MGMQDLDRNRSPQPLVLGAIDLAHAAGPKESGDLESSGECLAIRELSRGIRRRGDGMLEERANFGLPLPEIANHCGDIRRCIAEQSFALFGIGLEPTLEQFLRLLPLLWSHYLFLGSPPDL